MIGVSFPLERPIRRRDLPELFVGDFGARDNGSDATTAIQRAANEAASRGYPLTGRGLTYSVTEIKWPSGSDVRNIRLISAASTVDLRSPCTIDGESGAPVSNLRFFNVHVDGNRSLQTSIVAGREDGGRHAWRLLGKVSNVVIDSCSGNNSAGDGICIFSAGKRNPTDDATYTFESLVIRNSEFTGNRRHGGSADSIRGLNVSNTRFGSNGKDLDAGAPATSGLRGATLNSRTYGRPFDIEGYGIGTGYRDITFESCDMRGNIGGFLIMTGNTANGDTPGVYSRRNFYFRNCQFDAEDSLDNSFVTFAGTPSPAAATFYNLQLDNCTFDRHSVLLRSIDGLLISGRITVDGSTAIKYENVSNRRFSCLLNKPVGIVDNATKPAVTSRAGVTLNGTPSFRAPAYSLSDGSVRYQYTEKWDAAAAGNANIVIETGAGRVAVPICVSVINEATAVPILAIARTSSSGLSMLNVRAVIPASGTYILDVTFLRQGEA